MEKKQQYDMFIFLRTRKNDLINLMQTSQDFINRTKKEVQQIEEFLEGLWHVVCTTCNGMGEIVNYDGGDGYFVKCKICSGTGMRQ